MYVLELTLYFNCFNEIIKYLQRYLFLREMNMAILLLRISRICIILIQIYSQTQFIIN